MAPPDPPVGRLIGEGHCRGHGRRLHAGHRAHMFQELGVRIPSRHGVVSARFRVEAEERLAVEPVARIGAARHHRGADEQPGCGQQRERQGDLARHQEVAGPEAMQAAPNAGAFLAPHLGKQVQARDPPRGPQSRDDGREHTEQQRRQADAPVRRHDHREGLVHHGRERSHDEVHRPHREQEARGAADERQHQSFDQELPDDADAAGAQREAHRDLFAPARTARQLHVRDVEARHHQNNHRRAHQGRERDDQFIAVAVGRAHALAETGGPSGRKPLRALAEPDERAAGSGRGCRVRRSPRRASAPAAAGRRS